VSGAGYHRAAPGHLTGCDAFWGWRCSCGVGHDPKACGLQNCQRCWDAEWPTLTPIPPKPQ
jgi:hypothetical protein